MTIAWPRVAALVAKELRDLRQNRYVVLSMAVLPLVATVVPVLSLTSLPAAAPAPLVHKVLLSVSLEFFVVPTVVPNVVAGSAIIAERDQGTLEPLLSSPISALELYLGKLIAALVPTLAVAWGLYGLTMLIVGFAAPPEVVRALLTPLLILRQLGLDALLGGWALLVGLTSSTRARDVRTAQQVSALASLPVLLLLAVLVEGTVTLSVPVGVALAALLGAVDVVGLTLLARRFDAERLLTAQRPHRGPSPRT